MMIVIKTEQSNYVGLRRAYSSSKLGEMLEYASGKFSELKLNTNATKLNENLFIVFF